MAHFLRDARTPTRLSARMARADAQDVPAQLSERQIEILRLVGRGLTSKEIARIVGLSPHGVDMSLRKACARLGVAGRRDAWRLLESAETTINDRYYGPAWVPDAPVRQAVTASADEGDYGQRDDDRSRGRGASLARGTSGVSEALAVATADPNPDAEVHMGTARTADARPLDLAGFIGRAGGPFGRYAEGKGGTCAPGDALERASFGGFDPPRGGSSWSELTRRLTAIQLIALGLLTAILIGLLMAGVVVAAGSFMAAMQRTLSTPGF